jgi:hypothetical protein
MEKDGIWLSGLSIRSHQKPKEPQILLLFPLSIIFI